MRALRLVALLVAIPCALGGSARAAGGLAFGAGAPVDPAATSIQPNLASDPSGTLWLSSFSPGRKAFVRRSADGGDSFRSVGQVPFAPVGDVDVAVGDGGVLYAAGVIGPSTIGAAVSRDGGTTWDSDAFALSGPLDGRISLAVDRGATASADDDTAFLVVHHDGGAFLYSSQSGLGYRLAAGDGAIANGRCGALLFDPARRRLYLPCAAGPQVAVIAGDVPFGQSSGLVFRTFLAPRSPGGGPVGALLPSVAADVGGTIYAVWVDAADHDVFYAASPTGGASWIGPVRVNSGAARSSALPAAVAGAPGMLAIVWLAADSTRAGQQLPSLASSPVSATSYPWFGYAAVVARADTGRPAVSQQRLTEKPIHFGRIAPGDSGLGEYVAVALNGHGGIVAVLVDDTDQSHAGQLVAVRQLAGPTVLGSAIVEPQPRNPVADPAADAPPAADLTSLTLTQDEPTLLRARLQLAAPVADAAPGTVWLARFRVLSTGAKGERAYRVLYLGGLAGAPVTFFAGAAPCTGGVCAYPVDVPATGAVDGDVLIVTARLEGGFGAGVPVNGDLLYDVTGLTLNAGIDLDSTSPFDYKLAERIGRTTNRGRHIVGSGTIRDGRFRVDVFQQRTGKLTYSDRAARIGFSSTKILRVRMVTKRHAVISGRGTLQGRATPFVATVVDGGAGRARDSFAISLGGRYRRSGRLLSGGVTIR